MKLFCTTFRSSILKACALLGFIAAAPLAGAIPAHAQTPNTLLYLYSGVYDSGDPAHTGTATAIHCSNFSGADVNVQVLVFNTLGTLQANSAMSFPTNASRTAVTHLTNAYMSDLFLNPGTIRAGFALVVGSSPYIVCTAQVVDAAAATPVGFALHGVRYNPIPGTQE
jgi:hypothetical protein